MHQDQIYQIITKYQNLAAASCDDDQIHQYERFALYLEENLEIFEDDKYYQTEEDLLDDFHAVIAEFDEHYPAGDNDD